VAPIRPDTTKTGVNSVGQSSTTSLR